MYTKSDTTTRSDVRNPGESTLNHIRVHSALHPLVLKMYIVFLDSCNWLNMIKVKNLF